MSKKQQNLNILRLPAVCNKIGLSKPTVYRLMKQGRFPKSVPLTGIRAVGWIESEVDAWAESLRP